MSFIFHKINLSPWLSKRVGVFRGLETCLAGQPLPTPEESLVGPVLLDSHDPVIEECLQGAAPTVTIGQAKIERCLQFLTNIRTSESE